MRSFALAALFIAAACGGSKSKPTTPSNQPSNQPVTVAPPAEPAPTVAAGTPTDAEFEVMMGKAIAMFDAMGAAADASGTDCGLLATRLDQVMTDNAAFMAETKQYKGNAEMDRKGEEWMKSHMEQVMAPMKKVMEAGQRCAGDASFAAVMEKFSKLGE